jgi:hypothetical protein
MSPHPLASAAKKGSLKTLLRSSDRHSVRTKLQIPKIKNTASVRHPEHSSCSADWLAREAGSDEKASSTNRNLSRARSWCAANLRGNRRGPLFLPTKPHMLCAVTLHERKGVRTSTSTSSFTTRHNGPKPAFLSHSMLIKWPSLYFNAKR